MGQSLGKFSSRTCRRRHRRRMVCRKSRSASPCARVGSASLAACAFLRLVGCVRVSPHLLSRVVALHVLQHALRNRTASRSRAWHWLRGQFRRCRSPALAGPPDRATPARHRLRTPLCFRGNQCCSSRAPGTHRLRGKHRQPRRPPALRPSHSPAASGLAPHISARHRFDEHFNLSRNRRVHRHSPAPDHQ